MNIVFLDRDGTVVQEPTDKRIDSVDKIELAPHALEAMKLFKENDFKVVFITNQAGISEERITPKEFNHINDKIINRLAPSGITILKTYLCPHTPEDDCACRKPKPTMLLKAADDFDVDPNEVFMVGDRPSDVSAGISAGMNTVLIDASGENDSAQATYTAPDLLEAAKYIVENT